MNKQKRISKTLIFKVRFKVHHSLRFNWNGSQQGLVFLC